MEKIERMEADTPGNTQKTELPLSDAEWLKISRKNIQERLLITLESDNPHLIMSFLLSMKDYEGMAGRKGLNEQQFVQDMISAIGGSPRNEMILWSLKWALGEIKLVRKAAAELADSIAYKTRNSARLITLSELNEDTKDRTNVSIIEKSNLAGLYLEMFDETGIFHVTTLREIQGTPRWRLSGLQTMYEEIIQVIEDVKKQNAQRKK